MELDNTRAGNRWDSLTGQFGVLYFGSSLEACFGETLNRFRLDPALAFIRDEWEALGFMEPGSVPADWRHRRTAVRVTPDTDWLFLDVEDAATRAALEEELAPLLLLFEADGLSVDAIRGPDRRVTRAISQWVWQQVDHEETAVFAGIRYLSRHSNDWECWALFDDIPLIEQERQPILPNTDGLATVANLWNLRVF